MDGKIRLGISACLLGEKVRYDGGDKRDDLLIGALGPSVEFVPVCPEVEAGLGVPRAPMRLAGDPAAPRLVVISSGEDLTDRMLTFSRRRVQELAAKGLDAFVFKGGSPSCGIDRVPVEGAAVLALPEGIGIFARVVACRFPRLPMEDAERLHDPGVLKEFLEAAVHLRWLWGGA